MPFYIAEIASRVTEYYSIEADNADQASKFWLDGELFHSEVEESEVVGVQLDDIE